MRTLRLLAVSLVLACPSPPNPSLRLASADIEPADPVYEAPAPPRQARRVAARQRPAPPPEPAAPVLGPDFDPSLLGQVDGALSETERALREIRARRGGR